MKTQTRNSKQRFATLQEIFEKNSNGVAVPKDTGTEQAILGSMLVDEHAKIAAIGELGFIGDNNTPFYEQRHTEIYRAIYQLDEASTAVNALTVVQQMRRNQTLDECGGAAYLVELTEKVVTTAHIVDFCRLLKEHYYAREIYLICNEVGHDAISQREDIFKTMDSLQERVFDLRSAQVGKYSVPIAEITEEVIANIKHQHTNRKSVVGITSGLEDLDNITTGWQNTDLIILAARPSQGKTALCLKFALAAALHKESPVPVGIFSLEMGKQQLGLRLLCAEAGVDTQRIRKVMGTPEDYKQLDHARRILADAPIWIDDTAGTTPEALRTKARWLVQTHKVKLIIVDYLQLMEVSQPMDSREREISKISRSLKRIAKELNVPVIALSQLNRGLESRTNKRPMLSDLRESGAIEQDADLVLFIYRPETYGIDKWENGDNTSGMAEIIVGKQRNGPLGEVKTVFDGKTGRFENYVGKFPSFEPSPQGQQSF